MASLSPAQLPGDLLKALLQSLFTLFMGCLRRNRQEEGCEKQKRPSSCKLRGCREHSSLHGDPSHCGLWMVGKEQVQGQ